MFHGQINSLVSPALWGVVLLASWLGWGQALVWVLRLGEHGGELRWGVRMAWGLAVHIFLGGMLLSLHLATGEVLAAMTVIGAMLLIGLSARGWRAAWAVAARVQSLWHVPVIAGLVVAYAGGIAGTKWNVYDDLLAYNPMAKRVIDTGALEEPYSFRRLAAYGGETLLTADVMAMGSERNAWMVEKSLMPVLLIGLAWGILRPRGKWEHFIAVLLCLLILGVDYPDDNAQSVRSGMVFLVALCLALNLREEIWRGWRQAVVIGLNGAALCTLRASFIPAAAIMIAWVFLGRIISDRFHWRRHLRDLSLTALCVFAALLPWMVSEYASSGTFCYPLMAGNDRSDPNLLSAHLSAWKTFRWIGRVFMAHRSVVALPMMTFVLLCRRGMIAAWAMSVGAIVTSCLIAASLTNVSSPADLHRYIFPLIVAAFLVALLIALADVAKPWIRLCAQGLVVAACVWRLEMFFSPAAPGLDLAARWIVLDAKQPLMGQPREELYRRAQMAIPEGGAALAAVDFPSLFDYRRNQIYSADLLNVSPAPGMPLGRGPGELKAYLKAQHIDYLIVQTFEGPGTFHSDPQWREIFATWNSYQAPYLYGPLKGFHADAQELLQKEDVVFSEEELRVIHLK